MLTPSVHIDVDSKRFSPAGTKGNHRSNAITEFISPCGHAGLQLGNEGSWACPARRRTRRQGTPRRHAQLVGVLVGRALCAPRAHRRSPGCRGSPPARRSLRGPPSSAGTPCTKDCRARLRRSRARRSRRARRRGRSTADARQSKYGAGKQRNLLRNCAQLQLWGTHSCGKLGTRAHWAQADGTKRAPRKMRRQGATTPGATHRVSG